MMVADMSKKLKVFDKSDNTEEIDGELVISIEKLGEIQDELKKINVEATDKVFEIKQKYNEVSKPLYDKRNNLIKYIPNFWLTIFSIHPALKFLLNEEDHNIFKYLSSLEVEDHKDVKFGYSITFNFNLNPYFEDTKIVKSFTFLGEGTTKVTNTPIKWKEGQKIPNGISQEKKGNKMPPYDINFFTWFSEPEQKGDLNKIHDKIANLITDDLWLNPLNYFNNEDSDEADKNEDESCDGELVISIEKLEEIQDELKKINMETTDKVFEIKQNYNEVSKHLYDKRNNLIKYIPNFWLSVFLIHPELKFLLNEEDHKIFKHLISLEVEEDKDVKLGYSITFNFNPNPYFEDTKIVKSCTFLGEGRKKVINTPIKWKEGKEIPNEISQEKKGNKRPPSDIKFFNWFSEPEQKGDLNKIHDKIANLIKDDLWPNPLNYFNNEDSDEADKDESCDVEKDDDDSDDDDCDQDYDNEEDE